MRLMQGRAGLITGAAGGIGRATAVRFAQEGASVLIADLESQQALAEETVHLVEAAGGAARFVATDVTDEEQQREAITACVSSFGSLDFAVNNAGVDHRQKLEDTTLEDFERVVGVNLTGVFLGMKHQMRQMRQQGHGSIVNTASVAGVTAVPMLSAYVASKFGVVGLTRAAALEAATSGIRVNCVLPTVIRTAMSAQIPPEVVERLISPQAIKRLGEPKEVAANIVWLASDEASALTGVALPVDLGATAGTISVSVPGEF